MARKKTAIRKKRQQKTKTNVKTKKKPVAKKKSNKKKKVVSKKTRGNKKKVVVSKKRSASKKVVTKKRIATSGTKNVKEVLLDWSKISSPKKLYSEIVRQLNAPKKYVKKILDSSYPLEDLRHFVLSRLEMAFLPYTFVNVNVSQVKPAMCETMNLVIDQVLRKCSNKIRGTEVIIHENGPSAIVDLVPDPANKERNNFITSIARTEWPSRKNLPPSGSARNNELHRINNLHDQAVEYFVFTSDSSEELHLYVANYSWTQGYKHLMTLINNPACDLNTALLIFWSSGASYFQREHKQRPCAKEFGGYHRMAWDLVHKIMKNATAGKYSSSVMPDEFKQKLVIVPAERQLWKLDSIMYGDTNKKGIKRKVVKKKRITGKKTNRGKKHTTQHACASSKSELQWHLDVLQGVTSSNIQYFLGSEHLVNGSPESHSGLAACHVSEEVARCVSYYKALYFDSKNRLVEIRDYKKDTMLPDYEHSPQLQLTVDNGKHVYRKYELVQPHEFVPNKRGINQIGGSPPADLIVPKLSSGLVFQYLGLLNHLDPAFNLRHDLHLLYPLFTGFCMEVWIDYKNPLAPTVMNDKAISGGNWVNFNEGDDIVLESKPFKAAPWPTKAKHGGHTAVPHWIQYPKIPVCPKTNKPMELICQLGDGGLSLAEKKNSIIGKNLNRTSNFGEFSSKENTKWISGDGDLFVFFSRKSRVACYLYQGT